MSKEPLNDVPLSPDSIAGWRRRWLIPLGLLALLTLAIFGDVLFAAKDVVLSDGANDLASQFVHWRAFGFEELKRGNLALWNPHLFSGAPFFGGFQSALLYPPNALFLALPLARAINWSIALHVFLAGAFTYAWVVRRGMRPVAGLLAGSIFMFCGQHFLHINAGHLPNLCALVWIPLLLLAVDELVARPGLGPCLLGMFAAAMQVFAGHPQYVYFTALVVGVYAVVRCARSSSRGRIALGLVAIAAGAAALSAVQLLPGMLESRETLRGAGVSYDFAAMFSLPPENLLTLLAPGFFGGSAQLPYWGRCYLWEMSLFVSMTGLVLAIFGASGRGAGTRLALLMAAVTLVLAFGSHTPLFKVLYHGLPGFGSFRGSSKFGIFLSLFLAFLAGAGLDRLLCLKLPGRRWIGGLLGASLVIAVAAMVIRQETDGWWRRSLQRLPDTNESYLPASIYSDPTFLTQAATSASNGPLVSSAVLGLLAVGIGLAKRWPRLRVGLVVLALGELLVFARLSLSTFNLAAAIPPELKNFLAERPGDYRVLNLVNPNVALSLRARDVWGYDPGVPRRYAEFMTFAMGRDPNSATQYLPFTGEHPLPAQLRCRFAFAPAGDGGIQVREYTNALPRFRLVSDVRVLTKRDEILSTMAAPGFDPSRQVILETPPRPAPTVAERVGEVRLVAEDTDELILTADLAAPAILLITDTWFRGWRAVPLTGSSQSHYVVQPADYCFRAVPLAAGKHHFRLEYMPTGFQTGRAISIGAMIVFGVLVSFRLTRGWRGPTPLTSTADGRPV